MQAITVSRALSAFALATIVFLPNLEIFAFGLYVFAALSDAFDGVIARRFNVTTIGGAALDIACDKYLTIFSVLFLIANGGPLLPCLMALSRDILVQAFRPISIDGRQLFQPIRAIGVLVVIPIRFTTGFVLLIRALNLALPNMVTTLTWICGITSCVVLTISLAKDWGKFRRSFTPTNGWQH